MSEVTLSLELNDPTCRLPRCGRLADDPIHQPEES